MNYLIYIKNTSYFNKSINKSNQNVMKNVILNLKRGLFLMLMSIVTFGVLSQNITVNGTVKDVSGESMIGVTVQIEGTSTGTITDIDGNFVIPNVPSNGVLVVSYVGMKTVTVEVNNRTSINVVMEDDTELLDEIVVVGYGTMRKSDVTGAMPV